MTTQGGCGCGKVRYTLNEPALFTHACHCMDCQNMSGGAFLINMWIARDALDVTGRIETKDLPTDSGAGREVSACASCGTELWTRYHLAPANVLHLRAGTLDDTSRVSPAAHIFTRTMQPWIKLPDGVPAFEKMYTIKDFWPAESRERLAAIVDSGP